MNEVKNLIDYFGLSAESEFSLTEILILDKRVGFSIYENFDFLGSDNDPIIRQVETFFTNG